MMRPNGVEKQVRPTGWQPGANTIAYYPLNGDANDSSGNGYNGTRSNGAYYDTITSTKKGALFSGSNPYTRITTSLTGIPTTINMWWRKTDTGTTTEDWQQIVGTSTADSGQWQFRFYGFSYYYPNGEQSWVIKGTSDYKITQCSGVSNWDLGTMWHNLCIVKTSSGTSLYIDGSLKGTTTGEFTASQGTFWIGGPSYRSDRARCAMADLILESVERTAQEISDYYNLTKSNYGL